MPQHRAGNLRINPAITISYVVSSFPTFVGLAGWGDSVYCFAIPHFAVRAIMRERGAAGLLLRGGFENMKLRYCKRVQTEFPVIFAGDSYVGEGTVLNVSVPGCEIYSKKLVPPGAYLEMKVLVPDSGVSLCVGLAKVRWSEGHRFGVEFIRMPGDDQVRLGRLVKKRPGGLQSPARLRYA